MANDSTFYNRDKMWFGTSEFMQWIDTPNTGADVSNLSFSADTVLLNGGGYVRNSWDSHKTYQFSWGESASLALAHALNAYRNGSWGRGLIYFHDPMTYGTNILPKRWADPSMAANYEAAPLIPDVFPTTTPAAPGAAGLPVTSANYSLPTGYSSQANNSEHFIPIPPGMTLLLGATYSGTGKLYIRVDGNAPFDLPNLDPAGGVAVNVKVTGQKAYLGIRNTSGAPTSISIQGITARLADTARVPDYMGTPVTNLLPNPSFETAGGAVDIITNLITNPSFESGAGTVVVRSNRILNPSFEVDTAGWIPSGASATLSRTTAQAHRGAASMQIVTTGASTGEGAYTAPGAGGPITSGTAWSASAWIFAPAGAKMEVIPATTGTGGASPALRFDGTGAWQYVKAEGALPASSLNPYFVIRTSTAAGQAAQAITFYVDEVIMEYTPTIGPYFDGGVQSAPDPDFSTRWQGQAHATISELTGVAATGVTAADAARGTIRSSRWAAEGTYSARTLAFGSNNDSFAEFALPVTAGQTYTVIATARLEASLAGTLNSRARAIFTTGSLGVTQSASFPNAAGVYEVRHTVTASSSGTGYFRLYNGASAGNGDAWWDIVTLVAGAYGGPAFTGSTPSTDPDLFYAWTGATDASTSVLRGVGAASYTGTGGGVAIQSSVGVRDGVKSIRIIPRTTSDTAAQVTISGLTVGQTYTIVGYVTLTAPITAVSAFSLRFWVGGATTPPVSYTATATNAPGTYEVRGTFTAGATSHNIRFYNGSANMSDNVYWDTVGLFSGVYEGPWGSGTFTTPINIDEGQLPWYSGEGHSGVRFVGTPNLINYNGVNGGQMGLSCNLKEVGAWA